MLQTLQPSFGAPARSGIVMSRTNAEIAADEARGREAITEQKPELQGLAGHIAKCWDTARMHRDQSGISEELLRSQRQRNGEYDGDKLAKIRKRGGCDKFFNITNPKCLAGEALMQDVIMPLGDQSFAIDPTPLADLPEEAMREVGEQVAEQISEDQIQADPRAFWRLSNEVADQQLAALREEAKERADKHADKITDQMIEGGWEDAMSGFLRDLCTYKVAWFKGPIIRNKRRTKWTGDQIVVEEELVPFFSNPSPHDIYLSPNLKELGQGYLLERMKFTRGALAEMRDVPGWSGAAIDRVLAANPGSRIGDMVQGDNERNRLEGRDSIFADPYGDEVIEALEFWGSVSAKMLMDWGMSEAKLAAWKQDRRRPGSGIDPNEYFDVCALLVGTECVRAILNPDPLGEWPHNCSSFALKPGSIYGEGIPELIRDDQEGYSAAMRNWLDNAAFSAAPIFGIDTNSVAPESLMNCTMLQPRDVIFFDGNKLRNSGDKPIIPIVIESRADQFLQMAEYFEQKADDRTGIPRYAQGNGDVQGAGQTARGMNMLLQLLSKGIKLILANVDKNVQRRVIARLYRWNLKNLVGPQWEGIKGDCQVSAKGILAEIMKEETRMRLQEFAAMTNNPIDQAIIGQLCRAELLREIAKDMNKDPDKLVPSDQELKAQMQRQAVAAQAQMATGVAPGSGGNVVDMAPPASGLTDGGPASGAAPLGLQEGANG